VILINVIFTIFMLAAQWIVASGQPPAQVDSAHVPPKQIFLRSSIRGAWTNP